MQGEKKILFSLKKKSFTCKHALVLGRWEQKVENSTPNQKTQSFI